MNDSNSIDFEDRVRERAYELWLAEGKMHGFDQDYWFRAVKLVNAEILGFDEEWYLRNYPDVARAVANGRCQSGYSHYLAHGKIEGRYATASKARQPISSGPILNSPKGS